MSKIRTQLGILLIKSSNAFYRAARSLSLCLLKPGDLVALTRYCYLQPGHLAACRDDEIHLRGLNPSEKVFATKQLKPRSKILVVGCGAGRESIALARMGHEVFGIDFVEECVEAARTNARRSNLPATFFTLSADKMGELNETAFSAVMFSAFFYSLIPTSKKRVAILRETRKLLSLDGTIFLSFLAQPGSADTHFKLKRLIAFLTAGNTAMEKGDFVEGDGEFKHYFTAQDIRREAQLAGLSVIGLNTEEFDNCAVLGRIPDPLQAIGEQTLDPPRTLRPDPSS
jgi:2-polyprenyl-3-methyl-5-hydroxy-6-metoxy-1,4-benzoquinol methylase